MGTGFSGINEGLPTDVMESIFISRQMQRASEFFPSLGIYDIRDVTDLLGSHVQYKRHVSELLKGQFICPQANCQLKEAKIT
jgi:hypothetical protein